MRSRSLRLPVVALMVFALLWPPGPLSACGPFFPESIFTYANHPDFPTEPYTRGNLGVLQPSYWRIYLYIAYRNISGLPFTAQEQKSVWGPAPPPSPEGKNQDWVQAWIQARQSVLSTKASALDSFGGPGILRNLVYQNRYVSYYSCLQDAFRNAVATLEARKKQFGSASPEIQAWVVAQDQVFANCNGIDPVLGQANIPSPPDPGWPNILQADRNYQIAAAHFYAEQFDEAQMAFEQIARDTSSPWHRIAPYLVARALLRKATLRTYDETARPALLTEAESQLRRILADRSLGEIHPAAARLLSYISIRLRPAERLRELAFTLRTKSPNPNLGQGVVDYTFLLNRYTNVQVEMTGSYEDYQKELAEARDRRFRELEEIRKSDDLTDWILTFQDRGAASLGHALDKWRSTRSLPWLVTVVTKADATTPGREEWLAAAERVASDSPAWMSVRFHALRIQAEAGQIEAARKGLDAVLAGGKQRLNRSALNLFLALRMKLARDFHEFLRLAPRQPAGIAITDDDPFWLENVTDLVPRVIKPDQTSKTTRLDADAARILTEKIPFLLLAEASRNKRFPVHLRREVALATLSRAFLLGMQDVESEVQPAIRELAPELENNLNEHLKAGDYEERRFVTALTILRFPGMHPYVSAGLGRETPFAKIDNFRDNWWCSFAAPQEWSFGDHYRRKTRFSLALKALYPEEAVGFPSFLTPQQRKAAEEEWRKLSFLEGAPNVLSQIVIERARKHSEDPRVPEALHLAVRSTRYGCTDASSGKYSRTAFELLHRRYPKSEWAKKTKYWY